LTDLYALTMVTGYFHRIKVEGLGES